MAADIDRYLDHLPIEARPASFGYQFGKFAKRNKVAVASTGIVFAVLLASTLLISKFYFDQSLALQESQRQILIAEEINNFLNDDLLGQANPSHSGKKDPTVRELLDRAAAKVDGRFDELPEVEAGLRDTLGRTYIGLGVWVEAEKQLKKAIDLYAVMDDVEPGRIIHSRVGYSRTLIYQWKLEEAEKWCRQNLDDANSWLGEDHSLTATCHGNFAILLKRQGKFKEAESEYRKAIDILAESDDPKDMRVRNAQLNNLSLVLNDQKKFDESEEVIRQVVRNWREMDSRPVDMAFWSTFFGCTALAAIQSK